MRKQIEGSFPINEVNQKAMSEHVKKGHPGNVHLWWNRSPIESSALLLEAALEDESSPTGAPGTNKVTIVDPFCGSGCLTLAATNSELPVVAGDLNSVAVILTKAVAEHPVRFSNRPPVAQDAKLQIYSGLSGLAEDIRCYGEWIRQQLSARLSHFYPNALTPDDEGKQVYAWIWTRTAPCPNPACGCRMPLAGSYVLSRQKGREYYAEPVVERECVDFDVKPGAPASFLQGNKIGKQGARFRCPKCGTVSKDDYIKNVGQSGKLGIQLMAVGYSSEVGRYYTAPNTDQINAANSTICTDPPLGDIPDNSRWFSPPLFGLNSYADLYTPRQQKLMTSLCDLVGEAQKQCWKDAITAGFPDDHDSLDEGGTGAFAYSQAVGFYLSLVVSKLANYQSEVCTWDNRTGNLRAAFTRQAIPMTWTFAEGNPFSSVTGNFNSLLADVASTVENLPINAAAHVICCDARQFPFPRYSLLFTEFPYYDNVGYADLSDYFYVWLRRCLKDLFPGLFERIVSSKDELSSIPEHFGGDSGLAVKAYNAGLHQFFRRFHEFAVPDIPSLVFFEYGKQDEYTMSCQGAVENELSHWESFLDALIQAGFMITATLPARTELPNDNYETSRVVVVFRVRDEAAPQTLRRSFVAELKREIPTILPKRFAAGIDSVDRSIVGMGCGLALFSKYACIKNADGSDMGIHDALKLIWIEVSEYINTYETYDSIENSILEEEKHNG